MKKLISLMLIFFLINSSYTQKYNPLVSLEPDISVLQTLWGSVESVFGNKLNREFNRIARTGNIKELTNFFSMEFNKLSDEKRLKIIKKSPGVYFFSSLVIANGDNEKAIVSAAVISELAKSDKIHFTRKDFRSFKKLGKRGVNLINWVSQANITNAEARLRKKNIEEIISDIDNNIKNIKDTISNINTSISDLEEILKKKEQVEIIIKQNIKGDPSEFGRKIDAEIRKYEDDKVAANKVIFSPDLTKYPIGAYLDASLTNYAEVMSNAIIDVKNSHKDVTIQDIEVTLTLIGKADGRGKGKRITSFDSAKESYKISRVSYLLKQGWQGVSLIRNEDKVFNENNIEIYPYYNYELAFLRAFSFYKLISSKLEEKSIKVLETKINAIEYAEREDSCRGVDMNIQIGGLFKHYEREISKLNDERAAIDLEKSALEDRRESLLKEKTTLTNFFNDALDWINIIEGNQK